MLHTERIDYEALDTALTGYLAVEEPDRPGRRPGVLLMHEGGGQDDNVRARADQLARLGYVAFALDYFGGGRMHPLAAAQARLGELIEDRSATRQLAMAGYRTLVARDEVDGDRIAAVGYCFGGVMALELARAGVPLCAAIGFHPGLLAVEPLESAAITASVLMICGAEDPVVSTDDRARFEHEMRAAGVADWSLEVYGGVGHSFTNPDIASRGLPGFFAYDERADRRSWTAMVALLDEVFASSGRQ
ncbi:MAG TPA: dienelactone hydrolase family protein [Acidimicrobiales bacterium]